VLPSIVVDLAYLQRELLAYLTLRGITASHLTAAMGWGRQKAEKFFDRAEAGRSVLSETLAEIGAAVGVRAQWVAVRPEDDPEALRRKVVKAELDKLRTAYLNSVNERDAVKTVNVRLAEMHTQLASNHLHVLDTMSTLAVKLGYITEAERVEYLKEPKKVEAT
jgi:hypothetical protein